MAWRTARVPRQEFRRPWLNGSLVLSLAALVLAVLDISGHDLVRLQSAGMFAAISALWCS